ncbi:nitrate- and nitrite sensing domain-containing protein [Streptomyces sp. NPDC018045]|uniref:nitrate- and nitrite sensing domain-containing protein n=1 Tax=Streptomyces sp. NPDC018045 TaxID=3365037 RepID=UPI0037A5D198
MTGAVPGNTAFGAPSGTPAPGNAPDGAAPHPRTQNPGGAEAGTGPTPAPATGPKPTPDTGPAPAPGTAGLKSSPKAAPKGSPKAGPESSPEAGPETSAEHPPERGPKSTPAPPPPVAAPTGRRARVRNRLVGAVAVAALAVLGAGAPAVVSALDDVHDSQQLVDLAGLNAHAVTLAHSLADERDAMTEYVAGGRSAKSGGAGISESQRARVDRQISELRAASHGAAGATETYRAADRLLTALPRTRQKALSGPGQVTETFDAYTAAVQALGALSDAIARDLPARASDVAPDVRALPQLGRATDQAAAARALLVPALAAGGPQARLTAAAQQAVVREQAALAAFKQSASPKGRDAYDRTVNGGDVATAEGYLAKLTDQPRLDLDDQRLSSARVKTALTARLGLMRGVEASMATADIDRLGALRDDDVTALEIRIALVGVCLLLAVGASVSAWRSVTRPLAALRLGAARVAADPAGEAPVAFKGRNDEFADAVRSVNALHAQVGEVTRRVAELEGERGRLIGGRRRLAAEREVLQEERESLRQEVAVLTERMAALRTGVHGRFVNLGLRTLNLVERQLTVIESLEQKEQDPDRLETLFKLDHFAARMRRNSENLLVLAGTEHGAGHPGPVPLLDVLRASISEIERYERVRVQSLPPHSQVAGFAADDISHLVAELLENATAFSPPDSHVELSGWLLESGEVMLSVQDEGIGMTAERLAELNDRLADASGSDDSLDTADEILGLGLYVVVRLAARHGVRVQLRDQKQGGITAVVVLPAALLPTRPAPGSVAPSPPGGSGVQNLPGSVAEANSNTLQTRLPRLERGEADAEPPSVHTDTDGYGDADEDADGVPGAGPGVPGDASPEPAAADGAAVGTGPAAPDPVGDPLVAAAERAVGAAGTATPGTGEGTDTGTDVAEAPAAGQPSPYGPQSPGPYAKGAPDTDEHARSRDSARPAVPGAAAPTADTTGGPGAAGPYAAGPYAAGAGERAAAPADEGADAPRRPRLTDQGLPKRTPRIVAQKPPATPRTGNAAATAESLRARLGGFQQGARDGRRDVEAEIAERTAEQTIPQTDTDGAGAPGQSHVVEEARD